ncbi:MAG: YqiA/YcfP family alpha/beta fold hydrolase [Pseudomonadota bacterium]
MILYIHGFNSSAQSGKAREMAVWMAERGLGEAFACPDLPDSPTAAIRLLDGLLAESRGRAKLVGSSLGGFYATWLAEKHGLPAVLINPCVGCNVKLRDQVGTTQKNWHSGREWLFTAAHADELDALAVPAVTRPERYWLLAETGDAVLDYREAVDYYAGARQDVLEGGDHGFTRFQEYLPAILAF